MNPISRIIALFILISLVCFSSQLVGAQQVFYRIQIGAYKQLKINNFKQLQTVQGKLLTDHAQNGITRVLKGDYTTQGDAKKALMAIHSLGYTDAFIRKYNNPEPSKTPNSLSVDKSLGKYTVQIGAYRQSYKPTIKNVSDIGPIYYSNGQGLKKVMVGNFANIATARQALSILIARGYKTAFIKPYKPNKLSSHNSKKNPSINRKVDLGQKATTVSLPKKEKQEIHLVSNSSKKTTSNKQTRQDDKRAIAATKTKPTVYKKTSTTSASSYNKWIRFNDHFSHDYTYELSRQNGFLVADSMRKCESANLSKNEFDFLLADNGYKNYQAIGKYVIDHQHIGYLVEENGQTINSIRLYVFNTRSRTFTSTHYLSTSSLSNNHLYQNTQTYITYLNNDHFPDLLQRIIVERKDGYKSDVLVGKIWRDNEYQTYPINGKEKQFAYQLQFLVDRRMDQHFPSSITYYK